MSSSLRRACLLRLALLGALALPVSLVAAQTPYRTPPEEIVRIVDAPPLPWVTASPDGGALLLLERESLPPIRELARPMLRLAGVRVDPATNGRHGPRSIVGLTIRRIDGGDEIAVALPDDVGIGWPDWAPDGRRFAFTVTAGDGTSLWVGDSTTGEARALTGNELNTLGVSPTWLPDGSGLIVGLVPADRGAAPERSPVPTGPVIQENLGGEPAPVRTYQDLLQDAHDDALFEHYFTAQLAIVDSGDGARRLVGPPAIYVEADPSPTGELLLVERIGTPHSFLVPWYRFPIDVELWDMQGTVVAALAQLPLGERVPIQGVITGPRSHAWRANEGTAEVWWTEALDGGDPNVETDERDRLMVLRAPFDGEPEEVLRLEDRYSGRSWLAGGAGVLVSEYDRDERWLRTWLVDADGGADPVLVFDRSVQDQYGHPGSPVTEQNGAGRSVVRLDEAGRMLLTGRGASPEGDRPFLDVRVPGADAGERLWRNAGEEYETVVDVLPGPGPRVLTRAETPDTPPNYFLRDLSDDDGGARVTLTHFEHPAPELLGIHKELVTYERDDGVTLSATLYLPPDHADGQRHPLVVWAYPREFNDPSMAGQVRGSPWRFTMFGGSSHLALLTQGYVVMDGATMPVVGADPETVNDTFIDQIVASAAAAIQEAASRNLADPERVGVGGHSYGAFMTANLLAHSDLFRAGIARSGAYNRSLTPFGFQAERRTFWEAPDTYFALSPFMHADEIDEPMLMIHGMEDNNSGTFPIQSERMYHAIKGHGGTARLVMLPEESHGYRARESVLHTQAEMVEWFDRWVKPVETAN